MNELRRFMGLMALIGLALVAVGERTADAGGKAGGKLKFEIYQDKASEFRWRLLGGEGATIASSGQGYSAKQACKDGIESVKKNGTSDKAKFEIYEDKGKDFRWRLLATNGNNIASSSGSFKTKTDCETAIATLKKGLGAASVAEVKEAP